MTDKNIRICPECGKATVDYTIFGGTASCRGCGWRGKETDLLLVPMNPNGTDPEQLMVRFTLELRTLLAKVLGTPLVRFLADWGFLTDRTNDALVKKEAAMYLTNVARAVAVSIIKTREEIATNGRNPDAS